MKYTANDYGTVAALDALAAGAPKAKANAAYDAAFAARVRELTAHRLHVLDQPAPTRRPTEWERLHDYREQREAW